MFGWRGRLLRVDLSNGTIVSEMLNMDMARSHLGGRGLAVLLHAAKAPDSSAPLNAENPLIFMTGPLTGTLAPNGGRYAVVTRALPDGGLSAASMSGKWGAELKYAGFDGIIFEGAATKPMYLWVQDGNAELRSADHLSGKTVAATTDALRRETDAKASVACIGPAGENAIGCSVIANDYFSAAGGNGTGAVMGSKKLKAIVVRGTQGFRVADRERLLKSAGDLRAWMKDKPIAAKGSVAFDSVLFADSLSWDTVPPEFKQARTRGCFSCSTSFSKFESTSGKERLPLLAGSPPSELNERLQAYRTFVNYGLDFAAARRFLSSQGKEVNGNSEELAGMLACGDALPAGSFPGDSASMDRGPCFAAGYAIAPRLLSGSGRDDEQREMLAVLDSAGLCPFLAAGVGMETIAELLTAATGLEFSKDDVIQAGQRIGRMTPVK